MTNAQFYVGVAIPSVLIILAWMHQNVRLTEFRADVNRQFDRVDSRLLLIEQDQKQFFKTSGIVDGRLDELSARIK